MNWEKITDDKTPFEDGKECLVGWYDQFGIFAFYKAQFWRNGWFSGGTPVGGDKGPTYYMIIEAPEK